MGGFFTTRLRRGWASARKKPRSHPTIAERGILYIATGPSSSNGPRVFVRFLEMIHGHGPYAHAPAAPDRRLTLVAT